jgi:SAM-dependent methyltransferase
MRHQIRVAKLAPEQSSWRRARFGRVVALIEAAAAQRSGETVRVVDIGGTFAYWSALEDQWHHLPLHVTLINLVAERISDPRFTSLSGDARSLDFPSMTFDVLHSNSVIEHVGRWTDMCRMAAEVRRLAPRYYVQTPNYWFPVEPHFRLPFFHWLPEPVRYQMVRARSWGFYKRGETPDEAMRSIEDSTLLDAARFRHLFPDADFVRERVLGLTKSLIAVRS